MLDIRPTYEHCNKQLPFDSSDVMICSYEDTFCSDSMSHVLHHVCSSCGGVIENRTICTNELFNKYPTSTEVIHKFVDVVTQKKN